jgi:hypothetical protein
MNESPAPAVTVARNLLALAQLLSLALIFAPGLLGMAFHALGVHGEFPPGWVRVLGVVGFVMSTAGRIALPRGASRRERAWAELAQATGGELTVEKQSLGPLGWTGGPTVRWSVEGVTVTAAEARRDQSSRSTRISASFQAEKELRFSILPRNLLTRMLTSTQFVSFIQSRMESASRGAQPIVRTQAVREVALLAGENVALGDPRLDGQLLVKSSHPDLARYVLTGGGVTERMVALRQITKGWTLQLDRNDPSGASELMIELQGTTVPSAALRAAKELVDTVLGSLRRNGVIDEGALLHQANRRRAAN